MTAGSPVSPAVLAAAAARLFLGSVPAATVAPATPAAAAAGAAASAAPHVVVFQHGIVGSIEDLQNVAQALESAFPGRVRCVLSAVNSGRYGLDTLDGIAAGGARLAEVLRAECPAPDGCLSLVSHSLGGMYARWAVRSLEEEGWFDLHGVRAANFVTFATPHLGTGEIESHWRWGMWLGGTLLGDTVHDLALANENWRALVDAPALRALRRFRRLTAYGNLTDDLWVRPCSALLLPEAPCLTPSTGAPNVAPRDGLPQVGLPTLLAAPPAAPARLVEDRGDAWLEAFPAEHREAVDEMLSKLLELPWERYAVYFQSGWVPGAAHVKICHHGLEDPDNCGAPVVAHLCGRFLDLRPTDSVSPPPKTRREAERRCNFPHCGGCWAPLTCRTSAE